MSDLRWNVLTDPWIPLDDGNGQPSPASYVELMAGERDAADLVHPRDDCRFFARMLLSALTQALFPVANAKELRERMSVPMPREALERRVNEVKADFELVGPNAFMQAELRPEELGAAKDPAEASEAATESMFIDVPRKSRHLLFRPAARCEALCLSCSTILTYGSQAFAMEDGKSHFGLRGNSPSVRGRPATTTLISLASMREAAWANVLHGQCPAALGYAPDADRPWRQCSIDKPEGAAFGLLEGLFWQPRAFRLAGYPDGECFACGAHGRRLAPVAWRSKSRAKFGAFFRHPWSPVREDTQTRKLQYVHLASDRPAWTGLVDLLSPVAGSTESRKSIIHAAPVVQQWYESLHGPPASLIVFDIGTTKDNRATPANCVYEGFLLSDRLADLEVADGIRGCVEEAEGALAAMRKACVRLHLKERTDKRLTKSRAQRERSEKGRLHDATAAFWQRTEPCFWAAYDSFIGTEPDVGLKVREELCVAVSRTALDLFDAWAAPSVGDPSRIPLIAQTRSWLVRELPWTHSTPTPSSLRPETARTGVP